MKLRTCLALTVLWAGCGNDANNNGTNTLTPSVSLVQPSTVYLGRTLDVHLSGFDTMWTDTTSLSFGDGITVNKVTAASPTGLTANITIDSSAATGTRDVMVMDGSNNEVFKSSFEVSAPVKISFQGAVAQGSLSVMHVDLLDHDNLFDTTAQSGLFGTTYTNIAIKGPTGVTFSVSSVTPTSVDATVLTDVDAAAGGAPLDIQSGAPMSPNLVHNLAPASITIAARTAMPLGMGDNMGSPAMPFDSVLYQLTPGSGGNIVELAVTGSGSQMSQPQFVLLPKSGHFADLIDFTAKTTLITKTTDPYYVIFWDATGAAGYQFSITRKDSMVNIVAEQATTNDTTAMAQTLTLPALVQDADLSSATDVDFYKIVTAAGDNGKKIHVTTFAGDQGAGQAVDVLASNGNTSINNPAGPVDVGDFVDFLTSQLATAGNYYIKVANSTVDTGFGPPAPGKYNLWIRIE